MSEKDLPKAIPRKGRKSPNHHYRRGNSPFRGMTHVVGRSKKAYMPAAPEKEPVDDALEEAREKRKMAESIVEKNLDQVEEKFIENPLNRIYILNAAKKKYGIRLEQRYLESIEKSYKKGMDEEFNKEEPAVALGCRKHVTNEIGDLAKLRLKDEDNPDIKINITFNKIDVDIDDSDGDKKQIYTIPAATDAVEQPGNG